MGKGRREEEGWQEEHGKMHVEGVRRERRRRGERGYLMMDVSIWGTKRFMPITHEE
jgi:hypothetical protein